MNGSRFFCLVLLCVCPWGFGRALKTFYMDEICGALYPLSGSITLGETSVGRNSSGILKATNFASYRDDWSCSITLRAPVVYGVVVSIRKIDFREKCLDNITLISGISRLYCKALSDSNEKISFIGSNDVTVQFKSGRGRATFFNEFELSFTAYRKGVCTDGYEFTCDNGNCISSILTCDGHNHCGDRSDQKHCLRKSVGSMVGYFFGCLFLVIACVCGLMYWRRRRNRTVTGICHQQTPPTNYATVPYYTPQPQPLMPYSVGTQGCFPAQPPPQIPYPAAPYPPPAQSQMNYASAPPPPEYYPPQQQQYASNPTYGMVGNPSGK